jgi:hypothetical protein
MRAKEVLDRVAERYCGLARYRDKGTVVVSGKGPPLQGAFSTEFDRSGVLRFSFSTRSYEIQIVGGSGDIPLATKGLDPPPKTLSDAICGASGITFTASCNVPPMLLPDTIRVRTLAQARDPELLVSEAFQGERCFVVSLGPRPASGEALVSESRFLLLGFRIRRLRFTQAMADRAVVEGISVDRSVLHSESSVMVTYEPSP